MQVRDEKVKGYRFIIFLASISLLAAIVGALFGGLSGLLYSKGIITLKAAFDLIRYGAWIGLTAAVIAIVPTTILLLKRKFKPLITTGLALIIGGTAFGWPYAIVRHAETVPPIHDIATNPAKPPQFVTLAPIRRASPNGLVYGGGGQSVANAEEQALSSFLSSPAGKSNSQYKAIARKCETWGPTCLGAVQEAYYPSIRPLIVHQSDPQQVFNAALATANSMNWKIASANDKTGHIEATATTPWFGFKDDIVIDITHSANETIVNVRSESRLGLSDLGKNASRVKRYLRRLQRKLSAGKVHK